MQTSQAIFQRAMQTNDDSHAPLIRLGLRLLGLVLLAALWAATAQTAQAQATPQAVTPQVTTPQVEVNTVAGLNAINNGFGFEYAVPNDPRNLVADSAGRIWFTAPASNGIGVVTVTSGVDDPLIVYQVEFYSFPDNSEPYDIDFGSDAIWFSLRGANALGRMDINTREVQFFAIPSADAQPTGIDFGGEQVWLALNNARLASFDPATTTFVEYLFPDNLSATPQVADLIYQDSRSIWFTMPQANLVGIYNSVTDRFFTIPTGEPGPHGITLDADGRPWVTAIDSSRVGRYSPTTVSSWIWYNTPTPDSRPAKLIVFDSTDRREVWVTESATGTAGRIQLLNGFEIVKREPAHLANPAGEPWGITLTPNQHIWIADAGRNMLYELTPPYIYNLYFPFIETPAMETPAPPEAAQ